MHTLILVAGDDVDSILLPYSSHFEVEPYEVPVDGEDLQMLASHNGLQVTDTALLVQRIKPFFGEEGFDRNGRLFRVTRVNPQMQFDWYIIGGRWGAFLKLSVPRPTKRLLGLLTGPPLTHVASARKKEIDHEHLLSDPPAALVYDGKWHSGPIVLGGPLPDEWRQEFATVFATIPEDTLLHSVDIHN